MTSDLQHCCRGGSSSSRGIMGRHVVDEGNARVIIFGFRTMVKLLATVNLVCRNCHNPAAQQVIRRMRWFTLFFIPVFPVSVSRSMTCTFCGVTSKLSKTDAEHLAGAPGGAPQPGPAPQVNPPYGQPPQYGQPQYGQPPQGWQQPGQPGQPGPYRPQG